MAATSEVSIYNLALNAVGERSNVASPTESSREAEVCRLWYDSVLELVLAAAHWPEATKIEYLAQLEERGDEAWSSIEPRPGYRYVYALPSDCVRPRYTADFSKFLVTDYGNNVKALHSNTDQVILAYTAKINVAQFEPTLRMALAYGLAAHICMPLNGKPQRAKSLESKANELIWQAREIAANTSMERYEHIPDWIAVRGTNFVQSDAYFYPNGSLLTV